MCKSETTEYFKQGTTVQAVVRKFVIRKQHDIFNEAKVDVSTRVRVKPLYIFNERPFKAMYSYL